MADLRIVGQVRDYTELVQFLRHWYLSELNTTFEVIDKVAGLPDRYTGKLLMPKASKKIGPTSLGALLGAGGLTMMLAVDDDVLVRFRARSDWKDQSKYAPCSRKKRNMLTGSMLTSKKRSANGKRSTLHLVGNSDWGRMMRARRTLRNDHKKRSREARHAARLRWK